jgi:hypothetical protein
MTQILLVFEDFAMSSLWLVGGQLPATEYLGHLASEIGNPPSELY